MSQIPLNTQFIGLAATVDTTERRSATINAESAAYTMQDIVDTARPYKVFTALLTQSGGDSIQETDNIPLTLGVTYMIKQNSAQRGDFTNVGAPNNNDGTYFIATGTTPNGWGQDSVFYNEGAPVANVLENTIGNIWFQYEGVGYYSANSYVLFTPNKTYQNPVNYNLPNDITEGYSFVYQDDCVINLLVFQDGTTQDSSLLNTPIEIRVYN